MGVERDTYCSLVAGLVVFLPLGDGMKTPAVAGTRSPVAYSPVLPPTQNVGAHPTGRLVGVDFDMKEGTTIQEQLAAFSEAFGVDTEAGLTVSTPSGGAHFYLLWPEAVELPDGNWKIATLLVQGREQFKGDLRVAAITGHLVIPDSVVEGVRYQLVRALPPLPISVESALAIRAARRDLSPQAQQLEPEEEEAEGSAEGSPVAGGSSAPLEAASSPSPSPADFGGLAERPQPKRLRVLEALLQEKASLSLWHEKRAMVFSALCCCYCNETIQEYWEALDICRDTYQGGDKVPSNALFGDLRRLREKAPLVHNTLFCELKNPTPRPSRVTADPLVGPLTLEDLKLLTLSKLRKSSPWKTPQVVDLPKAVPAVLAASRKKNSAAMRLALLVLEDLVQPWANFGVSNIVLGLDFVSKFYGCSPQQSRVALSLLVKAGVLVLSNRPHTGVASTFQVAPAFVDRKLSKVLVAFRKSGRQVLVESRQAIFYDSVTGEVVGKVKVWHSPPPETEEEEEAAARHFARLLPPRQSERDLLTYLAEGSLSESGVPGG